MNPLWGGINLSALAGEIIASITNNSMYTYELSPFATLIEQALIRRMCDIIGFGDGNGTLTTGGSNGNMIGMMCARYHIDPLGQQRGFDCQKLVCYVSAESHYSVLMAANVLGIGFENVIKVPCDTEGRIRSDKLDEEIQRTKLNGQTPFCVVATAGTTVRGAFDPIKEIAEICSNHNIWFHVDAAWGGSCMFSAKHRSLMDGVELADSVCWDAHKMMGVPLICSAFLIKRPEILRKICSHGDVAHYLFHGDAGWARLIESYVGLADYLEATVKSHDKLEMRSQRVWSNVCFRYTVDGIDHNDVNNQIRERLVKSGNFMVSKSNVNEDVILRAVIANPGVTTESLDKFIVEVVKIGDDIIRGVPFNR
jgi:glutamate/tyrosine decarboxylase-like PLP-dependent enzyme